ncbi:MAG: hypothetical protein HN764_02775 [Gammaproteobacteria bacterium]|jgi:hypothetical protein|nr:hypothetical protein [Gammaproteobacteria bacterium]
MNESRIKNKILLIRAIDIAFLLAVFSLGIYAVLYSENGTIPGIASLIGLYFVNLLGNFSTTKIIKLNDDLKKYQNKDKRRI